MNRYYHQAIEFSIQCAVWVSLFISLIGVVLVLVTNVNPNYLFSVFGAILIVIVSTGGVMHHHMMGYYFGILEKTYSGLNDQIDCGEWVPWGALSTPETKYCDLELQQTAPIHFILRRCDLRVRVETGTMKKHKWIPFRYQTV
ncbi:MAG: hypothetical protein V3T82_01355 [Nitrospinaceae bacterium]